MPVRSEMSTATTPFDLVAIDSFPPSTDWTVPRMRNGCADWDGGWALAASASTAAQQDYDRRFHGPLRRLGSSIYRARGRTGMSWCRWAMLLYRGAGKASQVLPTQAPPSAPQRGQRRRLPQNVCRKPTCTSLSSSRFPDTASDTVSTSRWRKPTNAKLLPEPTRVCKSIA